jgi:hypothetical protein
MRWAGLIAYFGKIRHAFKMLVGQSKGKRPPLGRSRYRWEVNINMDLEEAGYDVDRTKLIQDRVHRQAVVNMVNKSSDFMKGGGVGIS